jgi:hypothetical protein
MADAEKAGASTNAQAENPINKSRFMCVLLKSRYRDKRRMSAERPGSASRGRRSNSGGQERNGNGPCRLIADTDQAFRDDDGRQGGTW